MAIIPAKTVCDICGCEKKVPFWNRYSLLITYDTNVTVEGDICDNCHKYMLQQVQNAVTKCKEKLKQDADSAAFRDRLEQVAYGLRLGCHVPTFK